MGVVHSPVAKSAVDVDDNTLVVRFSALVTMLGTLSVVQRHNFIFCNFDPISPMYCPWMSFLALHIFDTIFALISNISWLARVFWVTRTPWVVSPLSLVLECDMNPANLL